MHLRKAFLLFLSAAALIFAWFNRQRIMEISSVFLLSFGICMILAPVCAAMEKAGFRQTGAAAAAISLFVFILLLLVMLFVPYVVSQSIALIRQIIPPLQRLLEETGLFEGNIQSLDWSASGTAIQPAIGAATASIAKGSVSAAQFAGKFGFSLVLSFYFLRERKALCAHALLCLPVSSRSFVLGALDGCKNALKSYLSGMMKTSVFIGAATYFGLILLGIENAFLLAMCMGILEILPYVGPVLASVPILLSSMTLGLKCTLLSLALIIAIQQIEGNFVSPYFTAASTSVNPLASLISVFVLGTLFGLPGVFLAIPLLVSLRSLYWSICQMLRSGESIASV